MGKKIDAFVLTLAAALGLYFYFLGALGNRPAAIALALTCCALLAKLARRLYALLAQGRFLRRRRLRRCAGGVPMRLACMDEAGARDLLQDLLRASYGADCPLELVQLHPATRLPQERLFDAWRAHRGEAQLIVCATCPADAEARELAGTLRAPRVALVDAELIRRLVSEHPQGFDCADSPAPPRRKLLPRLRRMASLLVDRRNAPRGLLFAAAMLAMYALGGGLPYLIAAMALLFLALVALRRPPRPAKLF